MAFHQLYNKMTNYPMLSEVLPYTHTQINNGILILKFSFMNIISGVL